MALEIRLATGSDEAEVQAVVKAVYDEYGFTWDPEDYHADLFDLEEAYFRPGHAFWVALADGRVVGTAALCHHATIPGPAARVVSFEGQNRIAGTDCSLERLYVLAEARGRGIGRNLADVVIAHARSAGRRAMEIWSDKRFVEAHRLYRKLGATVVGDRVCHDPDRSPEWGLYLPLGSASAGSLER